MTIKLAELDKTPRLVLWATLRGLFYAMTQVEFIDVNEKTYEQIQDELGLPDNSNPLYISVEVPVIFGVMNTHIRNNSLHVSPEPSLVFKQTDWLGDRSWPKFHYTKGMDNLDIFMDVELTFGTVTTWIDKDCPFEFLYADAPNSGKLAGVRIQCFRAYLKRWLEDSNIPEQHHVAIQEWLDKFPS